MLFSLIVTLLDLLNIFRCILKNTIQRDLQIIIKSLLTTTKNYFKLLNRNCLRLIIKKVKNKFYCKIYDFLQKGERFKIIIVVLYFREQRKINLILEDNFREITDGFKEQNVH